MTAKSTACKRCRESVSLNAEMICLRCWYVTELGAPLQDMACGLPIPGDTEGRKCELPAGHGGHPQDGGCAVRDELRRAQADDEDARIAAENKVSAAEHEAQRGKGGK